jgi:hypothetical protein
LLIAESLGGIAFAALALGVPAENTARNNTAIPIRDFNELRRDFIETSSL